MPPGGLGTAKKHVGSRKKRTDAAPRKLNALLHDTRDNGNKTHCSWEGDVISGVSSKVEAEPGGCYGHATAVLTALSPPRVSWGHLLSGPTGFSCPVLPSTRAAGTRCGHRSTQPVGVEGVPPAAGEEEVPLVASNRGRPTGGGPVASGPVAAVDSPVVEQHQEVARHPAVQTQGPQGAVVPSRTFRPEVGPDPAGA